MEWWQTSRPLGDRKIGLHLITTAGFLDDILVNVRLTYAGGVIHGDLSGFNIVVTKDGKVLLIDWPQAVSVDHQNADELLRRDVENVLNYFMRKYGVERDIDEVIEYVKGD